MGRRSKVELFERIRLDRAREPEVSVRELARRHGVHRREVRAALVSAVPPTRKVAERSAPKLGAYHALIDKWLLDDRERKVPRKQWHTARRVWQRLVEEHGAEVTERAVCDRVRQRRRELGLGAEGFVPQEHPPGAEAEVDWGEATVVLAGVPTVVHFFVMRASFSGASYVQGFLHETQQAFLEAHAEAFGFFGGVFATIWYDNLTSAVRKVLRGRTRIQNERFALFRSHHGYASDFTLAGIRGAHEKGGVEGEVGRFRRRHMVPMPEVETLGELNTLLLAGCVRDLARRVTGRDERTVGEALDRERPLLAPVPEFAYVTYDVCEARVNDKSMVCVRQNHYSVPCRLIGQNVQVRVHARSVEAYSQQRLVALHERLGGRHGHAATLDHYLELLRHKPGAFAGSRALAQDRERGLWHDIYDELWRAIAERRGRQLAAREMVDVAMLAREVGPERLQIAVGEALAAGAHDGQAVAVLARRVDRQIPPLLAGLTDHLNTVGAAVPDLSSYDTLLTQGDN